MTIYSVDQDKENEGLKLVRRILIIGLPIIGVLILFMMGYFLWEDNLSASLILFLAFASMLGGVFVLRKQFIKLQESHKSTEIVLGEDYIALRQKYRPEIRIMKNEVTRLSASKNGFLVQTANKFHSIYIADNLIGYEDVKSRLSSWAAFQTTPTKDNLISMIPLFLPSLGVIVFAILVIITRSLWPVIFILLFFSFRWAYFAWINWQREDLTPQEKRNKVFYHGFHVILALFFLIYILIKII